MPPPPLTPPAPPMPDLTSPKLRVPVAAALAHEQNALFEIHVSGAADVKYAVAAPSHDNHRLAAGRRGRESAARDAHLASDAGSAG